ncbi:MAG: DUF3501 family protein [Deinococcus sp.]|nr:DUF3501 family protein [Deinococcus sp.]
MQKISLDDVRSNAVYERERAAFRQKIIALKRRRRLAVGGRISLVFENRDTVLFQIQEMMRVEGLTDLDSIRAEVEAYNELIPGDRELSATLFIELLDAAEVEPVLNKLVGIHQCVALRLGERHVIKAQFAPGTMTEEKVSAVHYLKFPFTPEQVKLFCAGTEPVWLVVDHPNYRHQLLLSPEVRQELAGDLA